VIKGSIAGTIMWMAPEILEKFNLYCDVLELKEKELIKFY